MDIKSGSVLYPHEIIRYDNENVVETNTLANIYPILRATTITVFIQTLLKAQLNAENSSLNHVILFITDKILMFTQII